MATRGGREVVGPIWVASIIIAIAAVIVAGVGVALLVTGLTLLGKIGESVSSEQGKLGKLMQFRAIYEHVKEKGSIFSGYLGPENNPEYDKLGDKLDEATVRETPQSRSERLRREQMVHSATIDIALATALLSSAGALLGLSGVLFVLFG